MYANAYIQRKYTDTHRIHTHRTHTPHTYAAVHKHTRKHTHIHAHARTHTASQYKGSDTLAQVRGYVFNRNGSAIDTRAGKKTHALVLARSFANRFE